MTTEQMQLDLLLSPHKKAILILKEEIIELRKNNPWYPIKSLCAKISAHEKKISRMRESHKVRYRKVITRHNYV